MENVENAERNVNNAPVGAPVRNVANTIWFLSMKRGDLSLVSAVVESKLLFDTYFPLNYQLQRQSRDKATNWQKPWRLPAVSPSL